MLKDRTAAELAAAFDDLPGFPHNTSALARLDEAAEPFAAKSAGVAEAHRRFSAARYAHKKAQRSEQAWQAALHAGDRLATALRELGDLRIARCHEPTHEATCNTQLDNDGHCPRATDHLVTP